MKRTGLIENLDNERALFGLFFALGNRLQVAGDNFYDEITCKQFFLLICLSLFQEEEPTINELSEIMGSSHQNVKQIVNKLEEKGFLKVYFDPNDKRKLRIHQTNKMNELKYKYQRQEMKFMNKLFEGLSKEEIKITLKSIQIIENNLIQIKEETV